MSTVSIGREFENQVAELYKLMGYEVKQNVGIQGHQIDIILTYTMPGGIKTKTAVECKYVERGNLRKNDIQNNINALTDLKRTYEVQQLVIVTTHGFAKDIWDTARANKIELLTFRELKHQILRLDQYLNLLVRDFETDELSKYYIDIVAQDDEEMPKEIYDPIDGYVSNWINNDESNHLSILGEYGTGKTSFCRKFAHDLALRYDEDPLSNRIPILVNLRDYSKVMTVRQLITDILINEYGLQGTNFPLFEKMNEEGLFLLIFDGFDEMAQKVVFEDAYSNFSKIAELAEPRKSKVILTCRTEFFRTHKQEKEILIDIGKRRNFNIIYLRGFSDAQIKRFLQKRVPLVEAQKERKQGWNYYYQKIHEIFDLEDLAKRPVLLELIVKYLPQLIEKGEAISASSLYLTTIDEELKRRLRVGKTIIQRKDRLKLMKLLAIWMYNNDKYSVHHEKILDLVDIEAHFGVRTRRDIEFHLHDFLTCSFLNRDAEGNYRFSHKSFVDFLVVYKFLEDIEKANRRDFMQKPITYEVIQFMKDFRINKDRLYEWIDSTRRKSFFETQYLGGNAVSLLRELGEDFHSKRFDFHETVLDYANFEGKDLSGLNFRWASLRNSNLNNTFLSNADFSFSNLKGSFEEMEKTFCVCWSPDGVYLVSGKEGGKLNARDKSDFKKRVSIGAHTGDIWDIVYISGGKYLATGSSDETIKIWDADTFREVKTLAGHSGLVTSVEYDSHRKYLASGSNDKTIKIWDADTFREVKTFKGHKEGVTALAYSPDGKYLASGSNDKIIKIWDADTFKVVETLKGHNLGIQSLSYSPDRKFLASGSRDNKVKIWDADTFREVETLASHTRDVLCMSYSPDGKYFATGSGDRTIKIWNADTFREIKTLKSHEGSVWDTAYSPDGKYLASGSSDKTIKIWDPDPQSDSFGECRYTVGQQIKCTGMIITGISGLKEEQVKFLIERGAVVL